MLRFFGRGSAFEDIHNSAYFRNGDDLVLIDCPLSAFNIIKKGALTDGVKRIKVAITHTHSDHTGGLPLLIHYAFYLFHIPVLVIAPSEEVKADLLYLIDRLDGCDPSGYELITADKAEEDWLLSVIPTSHTPALEGRCFGYELSIDGVHTVYTGDTCITSPYVPYLTEGTELYIEVCTRNSPVHLFIDDIIPFIREVEQKGVSVYLMHLDSEDKLEGIIRESGVKARFAPLISQ